MYKWKINTLHRASGSDMCFCFCRFYPQDQSSADLAPTAISICVWVVLCVLLPDNVRLFCGEVGEAQSVSEGRKRREKERRDGWGQFGGPGCFNYPLLCRWVRACYLSLALSLSHDLSSTFIPKPSAPLAKQRKKGGQRRGFTAVTMPHLPLISLNLLFFYVVQSRATSIKWPRWAVVVYEYGCWDGGSACTRSEPV